MGALKTREWKPRDHEKYGGEKRRTGKRGTKSPRWKRQDHCLWNAKHRDLVHSIDTLSPSNSADLNPMEYEVWGVWQARVYPTHIREVADLKRRLIAAWSGLQQHVIDNAVDVQWRGWLRVCEN